MTPTTTLVHQIRKAPPNVGRDQAALVEFFAERFPVGTSPRYRVRTVVTGGDRKVFERPCRTGDDPGVVVRCVAAAEFEFGDLPLTLDEMVGGADPDARYLASKLD